MALESVNVSQNLEEGFKFQNRSRDGIYIMIHCNS